MAEAKAPTNVPVDSPPQEPQTDDGPQYPVHNLKGEGILECPSEFITPVRRIKSHDDLELWTNSVAYERIMGFILLLNKAGQGKKISAVPKDHSPAIQRVLDILGELDQWVTDIPPVEQPMRFGNKAFRTWHEKLVAETPRLMAHVLPEQVSGAAEELGPYLTLGFGNEMRIDYGTGHELSFACWLAGLAVLNVFTEEDLEHVLFKCFVKYIDLVRRLQTVYMLEPAGSHGVWGLDDYQFLPFIWGSGQLIGHKYISPKSIHQVDIIEGFYKEYMYLACVRFVKTIKTGPFFEHSPYLNDISAVPSWSKINQGLFKMFKVEVLGKFPVVQHFVFGNIFPMSPVRKPEESAAAEGAPAAATSSV